MSDKEIHSDPLDVVDSNGAGGLVPDVEVSEEVIWKNRAIEAEEELGHLRERVSELEASLVKANEAVRQVERRSEIDMELTAAKAVDLETARLLTEAAIGEMDEPDVSVAVRELCSRKPFLFACKPSGVRLGGVSMGPGLSSGLGSGMSAGDGYEDLGSVAESARSSGDRNDLLRYLRVRRNR